MSAAFMPKVNLAQVPSGCLLNRRKKEHFKLLGVLVDLELLLQVGHSLIFLSAALTAFSASDEKCSCRTLSKAE